jgi:phospholipid/cholesterol/gamma-HCH transport system substrate-binding protein
MSTSTGPVPAQTEERRERSPVARGLAIAGVLAAVIAVAFLLFGGDDDGYRVTAYFQSSGALIKGNAVRVGGQQVGKITDVQLADNGQAAVEMRIDRFAPLRYGTTATIRAPSLPGVANRFVALSLAPRSQPSIADGGTLPADRTTSAVELDELFDAFDVRTRRGLQQIVHGSARVLEGRTTQAAASLDYLAPALANSDAFVAELIRSRAELRGVVRDTADLVSTLARRRVQLTNLVTNSNAVATPVAEHDTALTQTLDLLPATLRQANSTFVDLRATLVDLSALVAVAKPATRDLAPFLSVVGPLARDARPLTSDLRRVVSLPGPANDATDLLRTAPQLARLTGKTFPQAVRALDRLEPIVNFGRPYVPDLVGWFTKFGEAAAGYDANGHYARIQPIFNAFRFLPTPGGGTLVPQLPAQRLEGLETFKSKRCPGGAVQPSPDGSTPYRPSPDFPCDPDAAPPGP